MNRKSFIIVIFLFFSNTSLAGITEAELYVTKTAKEIFEITAQQKPVPAIRNELVEYIKSNIDINWMSKFVLGKHWRTANQTQKNTFVKLFEQYLIYNYAPKFQGYNDETYQVTATKEVAPGKYISKITLTLSNDTEIGLDIFILEKNSIYKIVDISGEGISFAATQRAEFGSMIATNGLDEFLVILEDKVATLEQNYNVAQTE